METKAGSSLIRLSHHVGLAVLDLVPDVVLAGDKKGRCTIANAAAANVIGLSSDEIVGRPLDEFIAPREQFLEAYKAAFRRDVRDVQLELRDADGRAIPVRWIWHSLPGDPKGKAGVVGIGRVLREQNRYKAEIDALASVAAATAKAVAFEDILDLALDRLSGVLDLGAAGILLFDEATQELHLIGYRGDLPHELALGSRVKLDESSAGEAIKNRRPVILRWGDAAGPDSMVSTMIAVDSDTGTAAAVPLECAGHPFGVLCVTFSSARVFQPDDLRILQAVSDQVAVALQRSKLYDTLGKDCAGLQATIDSLKELDEMRSSFVSAVSHELLTPVAIIKGHAETLRDAATRENPALLYAALTAIDEETERLRRLVANMLDVARIQAGGFHLELVPLALPPLLEKIVRRFRGRSRRHQIEVLFPENFPLLSADRERVESVLYNLLDNAIKYSPRGGRITVSGEVAEKEVLVRVSDEGLGIGWSEQERIFEPFYRVTGRLGSKAQGSGLGLFITKTIVDAHGGRIWVESRPGRGASFVFALPREAPPELPSVFNFSRRNENHSHNSSEGGVG